MCLVASSYLRTFVKHCISDKGFNYIVLELETVTTVYP